MRLWLMRLHLPTLAVAVMIVAAWALLSRHYGAYVLPPPGAVLQGLREIVVSGEVWKHTGASLYRIAVGFGGGRRRRAPRAGGLPVAGGPRGRARLPRRAE